MFLLAAIGNCSLDLLVVSFLHFEAKIKINYFLIYLDFWETLNNQGRLNLH